MFYLVEIQDLLKRQRVFGRGEDRPGSEETDEEEETSEQFVYSTTTVGLKPPDTL